MEELDNKWILSGKTNQDCKDKDGNNPVTLGLENMRGVFILVGLGIVGGVGLIVVEILYHKHKVRRERRAEAAKDAINRWKGTIEKRKTLRTVKESSALQKRFGHRPNGIRCPSGETKETLALSVDSLPDKRQYRSEAHLACLESRWQKAAEVARPKSTLTLAGGNLQSPPSLHSLPSAEFLRMLGTDHQLDSPINSLSFDFGRGGKRNKLRADSPDILRRSSPDLASVGLQGARDDAVSISARHQDQSVASSTVCSPECPDYESSDYAPVSTDGWVGLVPKPPPPPRQRVKGLFQGKGLEKGICHGKSQEKGLMCQGKISEKGCKGGQEKGAQCSGAKMRGAGTPSFACNSREAEDLIV